MRPTKPSEILEKAAAHMERVGLCKGTFFAFLDDRRGDGPCCGRGAVIFVRDIEHCRDRDFWSALRAMDIVTDGAFITFNDAPERTQAEVVEKLREAAELARKEGR